MGVGDPFLRAMSRISDTSTPPASVVSDADSTAAARHSSGPPSLDGYASGGEARIYLACVTAGDAKMLFCLADVTLASHQVSL